MTPREYQNGILFLIPGKLETVLSFESGQGLLEFSRGIRPRICALAALKLLTISSQISRAEPGIKHNTQFSLSKTAAWVARHASSLYSYRDGVRSPRDISKSTFMSNWYQSPGMGCWNGLMGFDAVEVAFGTDGLPLDATIPDSLASVMDPQASVFGSNEEIHRGNERNKSHQVDTACIFRRNGLNENPRERVGTPTKVRVVATSYMKCV